MSEALPLEGMTLAGSCSRLVLCCRWTQEGALFVSRRAKPHSILPSNVEYKIKPTITFIHLGLLSTELCVRLEATFPVIYSYTLRLLLQLLSTIGLSITQTCFFCLRLLLHAPPPAPIHYSRQCSSRDNSVLKLLIMELGVVLSVVYVSPPLKLSLF
jgi:hypothetical protein